MVIIADRSFRSHAATPLVPYFKTLGNNISTKPEFDAFKTLGTDLLTANTDLERYNDAVLARDLRELGNRDTSKAESIKIALLICDEVNKIANNDPAVYDNAGLRYKEKASLDRPIGITSIISVKFNPNTSRLDLRVRKADRAKGYRIDLRMPNGDIIEEYGTIADTKGSVPAPKVPGTYRCRAVPVDSKGNLGEPSGWSVDFGVY
ncbi:MAG: hypothetical protein GC192_12595 [Bacteroidetes bacterium]|nr:hypothetical protein [Bacteroidota bacterium]